jgi:hypothetical protein
MPNIPAAVVPKLSPGTGTPAAPTPAETALTEAPSLAAYGGE